MSEFAAIVRAHASVAQDRGREIGRSLVPQVAPPAVSLRVVEGMQRDSRTGLAKQVVRVGRAFDNDIVLVDDGVDGTHATLELRRSVFGDVVSVTPIASDVRVGQEIVRPGTASRFFRLPQTLCFGSAAVRVENAPAGAFAASGAFARRWFWAAAAFTGMLFLPTHALLHDAAAWSLSMTPMETTEAALAGGAETPTPLAAPPGPDGHELMNAGMAKTGLDRFLTIETPDEGVLRVTGSLPEVMAADWQALQARYDDARPSTQVISDVTEAPTLRDLPPIASIRLGATPEVVFVGGQRLRPGDVVTEGWRISEIGKDGLVLARGPERLDVSY